MTLRIAILSMQETRSDGDGLCADLVVGAATLANHQLTMALACDCKKIICIAPNFSPELGAMQHVAERIGASFHCVTGAVALGGLITANDEVLVVSDGLLAPPHFARDLVSKGNFVLVQPVDQGLAAGFQRIDADYADAGLMRVPGRLIERLHELPSDCDVASALIRIALQAGVARHNLSPAISGKAYVRFVRNQAQADASGAEWFDSLLTSNGKKTAGTWIAYQFVKLLGPATMRAGWGSGSFAAVAGVLLLVAVGAAVLAWPGFGLFLCALSWISGRCAGILRRIERDLLLKSGPGLARNTITDWAVDMGLIAILGLSAGSSIGLQNHIIAGFSEWQPFFAPVMLIIIMRLVPAIISYAGAIWLNDRALVCSIFIVAVMMNSLAPAIALLGMAYGVLGVGWLQLRPPARTG